MMLAILFAVSSGFTLFSHVCFMGGAREISSKQIISCCSAETQTAASQLSSDCCNDDVRFIKFDFTSLISQHQAQQHILPADFLISSVYNGNEELTSSILYYNNLPPPKSGREILSSIKVFRI